MSERSQIGSANSLFQPIISLIRQKKFPVCLGREFIAGIAVAVA